MENWSVALDVRGQVFAVLVRQAVLEGATHCNREGERERGQRMTGLGEEMLVQRSANQGNTAMFRNGKISSQVDEKQNSVNFLTQNLRKTKKKKSYHD